MQVAEQKLEILAVKRESGVALIIFDAPSKFNTLGSRTNLELEQVLDRLDADPEVRASVIVSGKPDSFIVGADLVEIRKLDTVAELQQLSRQGQQLFNRVSQSAKPIVGAINGTCLGGGLELALTFAYRVATNSSVTQFGLPETRLGIIPGLGGTQRLPAKIGLKAALDMILTGDAVTAEQALSMGLVDEVVHPDQLIETAERHAVRIADERKERLEAPAMAAAESNTNESVAEIPTGQLKATPLCTTDLSPEKALKFLAVTQRAIRTRTRGNYPAQDHAIAAVREGIEKGFAAGLEYECNAFATLAAGDVSSNLMSLFFSQDFAKQAGKALVKKFPGAPVKSVGVVGAGKMGTSVAQLAVSHGIAAVVRTDSNAEEIKERVLALAKIFQKQGTNKTDVHLLDAEKAATLVKIVGDDKELAETDLIVECVLEDTPIKNAMLERCSQGAGEEAVIASNTSGLSITELSASVADAERFIGLHFFHPVDKMPLVEVVAHPHTSRAALARAVDFVLRIGKTPLMVKDGPGFLVNRLLLAYLVEVAHLLDEGTPANWIEEAAIDFGMPMGPLQLMDEIGIEVCFSVARALPLRLGRLKASPVLDRTSQLNFKGKQGNRGFYLWEDCEKRLGFNPDLADKCGYMFSPEKSTPEERARLVDRMICVMADEGAYCLEDKIVSKPREVDLGIVLGIGFPAFRGGVLKYADSIGLPKLLQKLESFYATTSGNRQVSPLLKKYIAMGRSFYSLSGKDE